MPGVNRALVTLPLSHAYGLLVTIAGMHSPEPAGRRAAAVVRPDAFLELIQEHRLQLSAVVPSMLQILLAQPLEDYDLSSLQYVTLRRRAARAARSRRSSSAASRRSRSARATG